MGGEGRGLSCGQRLDWYRELVERMIHAGERLAPELRKALVAAGAAVVPELMRVLENEALAMADAPGEGYAPVHAAEVLHALRAPEAIEPMLRELVRGDALTIIHDRLIAWLPYSGPAVLEPAWALYERTADEEARASLRAVMARLGVKYAWTFDALVADLERALDRAAMNVYDYGRPAALPHLERSPGT